MTPSLLRPASMAALLLFATRSAGAGPSPAAEPQFSIQAALDSRPGTMIHVPAGDHLIDTAIRIRNDRSGLFGEGRIIQGNPEAPIVVIEGCRDVQIRDLTLTRPKENEVTDAEAVLAIGCRDLVLSGVQVINNRTRAGAISIRECRDTDVLNCRVRNYMRLTIDDRTASKDWGYAFTCIDGTGISVSYSQGSNLTGNRVVEEDLLPTREVQAKNGLGKFVKKNPEKGLLIAQKVWDEEIVTNWHQGSGIVVNAPESNDQTRIIGNHIENAAQGIDLHADHVIVSGNVVCDAFIGMKAMHGSRNVIIVGNQFSRNDLWSIGLMPGAGSHAGSVASSEGPAARPNVDGGSIIANNIISDFGRGHAAWVWEGQGTPIRFDNRQKPHNPPLTDVVVQGNIVYDSQKDEAHEAGAVAPPSPRYEYAVRIAAEVQGLHFSGNLFHPGKSGVSNIPLNP